MEKQIQQHYDRALAAIQKYYKQVQTALLYLETLQGKRSLSAFIDIRDILSHLVSITECEDEEAARDNYANLCEHMRRAIAEPYQLALELKLRELRDRYSLYLKNHLRRERLFFISRAETQQLRVDIEKKMETAAKLWEEGRHLKSKNMWTADFETAVNNFREGVEVLKDTEHKLLHLYTLYYDRKAQILVGLSFFILASIVAVAIALLSGAGSPGGK